MRTVQIAHEGHDHTQTESGEVQAAETKTLQSGFSPLTQTTIFLVFIAAVALGVVVLRTTSWHRHKKR